VNLEDPYLQEDDQLHPMHYGESEVEELDGEEVTRDRGSS
jgi:hypothetical protein